MLTTYLASITKNAAAVNDLVDKFNIAHDKGRRRGGMI